MKALLLEDVRKISIQEYPEPPKKDDHIITKVNAVGICGSDLHYFSEGGIGSANVGSGFVPGHEFSAILMESIPEMNLEEGEHVAVDPAKPCFKCQWCKKGYENLCPYVEFIGAPPFNGAMAQYVSIKKHQIHKIPKHFSPETAVLLETLGVALHAVDLSKVKFHQEICILGSGPVGLCILKILKSMGAKAIYVIDPINYRVQHALKNGAEHIFKSVDDFVQYKNGSGVDLVFEATNSPEGLNLSIHASNIGGKIIVVGIPDGDNYQFKASEARRRGISIKFSRRMGEVYDRTISMVEKGLVALDDLATHTYALNDGDKAFINNLEYRDSVLKSIIFPNK